MEDLDAGLGKEAMQHALVGASLGSGSKPGPKLCEHDERHEDRLDGLQPLDDIALGYACTRRKRPEPSTRQATRSR
jgi:hypothetical protein